MYSDKNKTIKVNNTIIREKQKLFTDYLSNHKINYGF